ncbi:assimilatory nitrate reductase NasA [Haloplanus aerogenes]|uniref:Nitrate reductase n=1 Tax=Haloplanus aerogenes TaxID=660522 RepID=A0A3M0DW13_9EURY|nr:assimilatory nitrate reductase NasA [Haloplanus aerogenes]AZH24428.1 nitrate reductase [Haloplanus aerogenes]RMB23929.1 assimilatory nitrate reductase catalytic subunit [Haloplanus aerogenes]
MTDPVPTTCMRCAVGCGLIQRGVDIGYGIDTVRGNANDPVNRGMACSRGISETADPDGEWLTRPMVRRDGELTKTTWDTALFEAQRGLGEAMDRNPDAVAILGSGQQTNEAAYALGKLARGGIGTRYYDANTTLCMASAVTAYYDAFGSDAPPPTYEDISKAETHVVWGANPAVAHPVMCRWITQSAEDGTLIVVDPVRTKTARAADHHVAVDPGGDLDLARAVLARVVETGGVDEAFVDAATTGFDDLELPDSEAAADRAGVPLSTVDRLVETLADDTLIYWGMGVNQSVQGTDTAGALIDLCLATGNLGPGTGPFSLTGQANSMGTRVCSSKGTWPGHHDFDDPEEREVVADAWGVPVERLPDDTGPGPVGIVDAVREGSVEAVYTVATNPVAGMPDATDVADALEDAFLVVQDAFRTETVEHADVVLPAATWGESNGTAINMERTVSRIRPASDLPRGVRTDLNIIQTLGNVLVNDLFDPTAAPAAVFDEFAALTAGTDADCSGISHERLDEELAVRWPASDAETSAGYRYYEGEEPRSSESREEPRSSEGRTASGDGGDAVAPDDWSFPTPSGRARFSDGTGRPLPEPTDEEYPLLLTTAREADGYNTGVRSRESPDDPGTLVARVHPDTLDDHREVIEPNEADDLLVRVASRRGEVIARVTADDAIPSDVVWLPIHHPATNDLTHPATDPRSDEPNLKQCAVRLARPESDTVTPAFERERPPQHP